jgi:hypothetical protein
MALDKTRIRNYGSGKRIKCGTFPGKKDKMGGKDKDKMGGNHTERGIKWEGRVRIGNEKL